MSKGYPKRSGKKRRTVQLAALFIAALCLASTVFFLGYRQNNLARKKQEMLEQWNKMKQEYQDQWDLLIDEQQVLLEEQERLSEKGKRMSVLFFEQCSAELYETVFLLKAKPMNAVCTFAVSEESIFEKDGCITSQMCKEMLEAGWSVAIADYQPENSAFGSLSEYIDHMKNVFAENGIPFPDSCFFRVGSFSRASAEEMIGYGFKNIVCEMTESDSAGEIPLTEEDGVLYIPYLSASSERQVYDTYSAYIDAGIKCSVAVRNALLKLEDESKEDIQLVAWTNMAEYMQEGQYLRSLPSYRQECLEAGREITVRLGEIEERLAQIKVEFAQIREKISQL